MTNYHQKLILTLREWINLINNKIITWWSIIEPYGIANIWQWSHLIIQLIFFSATFPLFLSQNHIFHFFFFHLKWTLIEMCNGIKTKIAQSFKQSMYCGCLYLLLWLHAVANIIIKISAIALFTCTTLLFNSLSLSLFFFVLCVIHRRRFTATYYYFISVSGIVHTLHSVDFCGLSRGVFHFFIPLLLLVLFILFFRNAVIQYSLSLLLAHSL
jgi:hypothetical protein